MSEETTPDSLKLVFDEPKQKVKPPKHFADLDPAGRKELALELGIPGFRANQAAIHFFTHYNDDTESWSDIPKDLRQLMAEKFTPPMITLVRSIECDGGTTRKDLWRLHDGVLVESVLMRYTERTTVCISSQAGCGMNCPFCATGQSGLTRNLTAGEITAQVVAAARACANGELPRGPTRLSNVVFMGMGEPLLNLKAVIPAVRTMIDRLGIGARKITISTVGVPRAIGRLAAEGWQVGLAVSLHAPTQALRESIVPSAKR